MSASGLTKRTLAERMGLHETTVGKWVLGRNQPSLDYLAKLARALGVSADWLLGLSERRALDTTATPELAPAGLPPRARKELEEMAERLEGEVARMRKKLEQPR